MSEAAPGHVQPPGHDQPGQGDTTVPDGPCPQRQVAPVPSCKGRAGIFLTSARPRAAQARGAGRPGQKGPPGHIPCQQQDGHQPQSSQEHGRAQHGGKGCSTATQGGPARWELHHAPTWVIFSDVHTKISPTVPRGCEPKAPCWLAHPSLPGDPAAELTLAGFSTLWRLPGLSLSAGICLFCT